MQEWVELAAQVLLRLTETLVVLFQEKAWSFAFFCHQSLSVEGHTLQHCQEHTMVVWEGFVTVRKCLPAAPPAVCKDWQPGTGTV